MKKVILLVGFMLSVTVAMAQGSLEKGAVQLNAGLGLGGWGISGYVGADLAVHQDITVGGVISYLSDQSGVVKTTGLGISANSNYHFNRIFNLPEKFDLYAGLSLAYTNWKYSAGTLNNSAIGLFAQTGGRYFFTDDFGVNLEFGAGSFTGARAGITYKF